MITHGLISYRTDGKRQDFFFINPFFYSAKEPKHSVQNQPKSDFETNLRPLVLNQSSPFVRHAATEPKNKHQGSVSTEAAAAGAGGDDAAVDGDKRQSSSSFETAATESEKSWKLIVLPGIERVFAFQVSGEKYHAK